MPILKSITPSGHAIGSQLVLCVLITAMALMRPSLASEYSFEDWKVELDEKSVMAFASTTNAADETFGVWCANETGICYISYVLELTCNQGEFYPVEFKSQSTHFSTEAQCRHSLKFPETGMPSRAYLFTAFARDSRDLLIAFQKDVSIDIRISGQNGRYNNRFSLMGASMAYLAAASFADMNSGGGRPEKGFFFERFHE